MEERDVIQLLRHYRHDLLNQLQIVDGYLSMEKTDKARTKLLDYTKHLQEESKLVNLNAPSFALYVLQLDTLYPNFRSAYSIHTHDRDLQHVDSLLVEYCKKVMAITDHMTDTMELYDIHLHVHDRSADMIQLELRMNGKFPDLPALNEKINNAGKMVTVLEHGNDIVCTIDIPCK
ncbi:Spo0B domain-containing protein [Lentibacillus juripiscarius]|uniref:Spo0B domain-containing protein n=1 Tax=Lentibacillus juripiscarius TaxID=257446 RepID=A0ABW5V2A4_9BACI